MYLGIAIMFRSQKSGKSGQGRQAGKSGQPGQPGQAAPSRKLPFQCHECGELFDLQDDWEVHNLSNHVPHEDDGGRTDTPTSFKHCEHVGPAREQIAAYDPKLLERIVQAFKEHHSDGIVPIPLPTLFPIPLIFGLWRGLEGHNNSCYFDVLMMAMFAFTTCFDGIFSPEQLSGANLGNVILLRMLADLIVRPLRERMFVPRSAFGAIRQYLSEITRDAGYERHSLMDPSELLMHFSDNISGFKSICSYSSNTEVTTKILILPTYTGECEGITAQDLYNSHCHENNIVFLKPPNAFFLQMRLAIGSYQMFPPSPVLTIYVKGLARNFIMELCAITCVIQCHHVAFLRLPHRGADGMHVWALYDSMRGIEAGHKLPLLFEVPGLARYLETGDESDLPIKNDGEGRNGFVELLKKYAYLSLYCLTDKYRPSTTDVRFAEAKTAAELADVSQVVHPSHARFDQIKYRRMFVGVRDDGALMMESMNNPLILETPFVGGSLGTALVERLMAVCPGPKYLAFRKVEDVPYTNSILTFGEKQYVIFGFCDDGDNFVHSEMPTNGGWKRTSALSGATQVVTQTSILNDYWKAAKLFLLKRLK